MAGKTLPKISLIGSGIVGSSLCLALFEKGYPIASIINRTGKPAIALAKAVRCRRASTHVHDLHPSSAIVIIAVSDESLQEVAASIAQVKHLDFKKLFVAHTSGVYPADV